ncbi:MAG: hypothetical protein N2260_06850 [Syntrophobacterales bacterium]|nr:hypothetical protein [Syntrophobacterales bacterium]
MKRDKLFKGLTILCILLLPFTTHGQEDHLYFNGKIEEFDKDKIFISFGDGRGCALCLCKGVRYLAHLKQDNTILEEPTREGNISKGKWATILAKSGDYPLTCLIPSNLAFQNICKANHCASTVIVEEYRK